MDFICLEAGCYPHLPILTQMLLEPLEMEATFSGEISTSPHVITVIKKKVPGHKMSVSGEVSQPSSPVPSHLPCFPPRTVLLAFGITSLLTLLSSSISLVKTQIKSTPPGCLADHPVPPWTAPFPVPPTAKLPLLNESVIHRYYPWIPHWLAKCAIMTLKLECRLPEGRRYFLHPVPHCGLH